MEADLWWQEMAGVAGPAYGGGQDWFCPVPVAVADRLYGGTGMVTEQPALSFAGLLRRLRAEAKLTQEELAAAAGVSPRSVSNLERGINRTAHKDTAVLLAGALGRPGRGRVVCGGGPRPRPGRTGPGGRRRRGAAAGSGDRFSLPRAGRVRGTGCGVLLRPRSGHGPGAGADVTAPGGRGAAGGVGGVGGGQVVAAAGRGAAADPGGRAGVGPRGGVVAMPGVDPDPGAAG